MRDFEGSLVRVREGAVRGHAGEEHTWVWKGIPYAAPPVGELRWRAPRDPEPWEGVREQRDWPPLACQRAGNRGEGTSEDCLYLNVWRPRSGESGLPVYFWIHGGGNFVAMPANPATPGHAIAARGNMVVVTFHYRLAQLGWLTHPKLRGGAEEEALDESGNYGLLDIIKALQWVRDNIEAFGGDPGNVTIAGESAGGQDVFALLACPMASGLFHRAIASSGNTSFVPRDVADRSADRTIRALMRLDGTAQDDAAAAERIDGMSREALWAYLRGKSFADFLRVEKHGGRPAPGCYADGLVLPTDAASAFARGAHPNRVPTIVGMNRDEDKLTMFSMRAYREMDEETYRTAARYSSDLRRARFCDAPLRGMRDTEGQPPVYGYYMRWGSESGHAPVSDKLARRLGCYHAIDIAFFFNVWDNLPVNRLVFDDDNAAGREALSQAMMAYAAAFARTGDPNPAGSDLPTWEPWDNGQSTPKLLVLDADRERARIAMGSEELKPDAVRARLAEMPEAVRPIAERISATKLSQAAG